MRSELINNLNLSKDAKILLRACVEWCIWHKSDEFGNNYKQEGVFMDAVYVNSRLPFSLAIKAIKELKEWSLLDVSGHSERHFVLYYRTLLLSIHSAIENMELQYPLQNFNALKEVEELIKKLPEPTLG